MKRVLVPVMTAALLACCWIVITRAQQPADKLAEPVTTSGLTPAEKEDKDLASQCRMLIEKYRGGVAQEQVNFSDSEDSLSKLERQSAASDRDLRIARKNAYAMLSALNQAPTWPKPAAVTIARAKGEIVVDGKLDDEPWKNAKPTGNWHELSVPQPVGDKDPKTVVKMLWDDKNLYFAFDCDDADIQTPKVEHDGAVCNIDCVEVFIMPDKRWSLYWELNLGADGTVYDSLQCKDIYKRGLFARTWEEIAGMQTKVTVKNGPDGKPAGYLAEIAIPVDQIPYFEAKPGKTFYLLASRVDLNKAAGGKMDTRYFAFTPILTWFHNIYCYCPATLTE